MWRSVAHSPVMKSVPPGVLEPGSAEYTIVPMPTAEVGPHQHRFSYRGRDYTLIRLVPDPSAPWYGRVKVKGKQIKFCLKTNNRSDAEKRAKLRLGQILDQQWKPAAAPAVRAVSTLADVFRVYPTLALISPEIVRNNMTMMGRVIRLGLGVEDPALVKLTAITESLAEAMEHNLVEAYTSKACAPSAVREARLRALRTAKSIHNQAKSIFNSKRRFIVKYAERGLMIPDCVRGFCEASMSGRINKASYSPPDQTVIKTTFDRLAELAAADPAAHLLFWLMVGTGMRRSECAEFKGEDLHESEGALWVSGGIGKDGKIVQVRVQSKAVPHLRPLLGTRGPALPGEFRMRHDTIPARLNVWLRGIGWGDQKAGHALRAYIGGLIYSKNPRAAQAYLRHKSITTTESFYSHFATMQQSDIDCL